MSINNLSFQLKPSKIAWFFQFGCYVVLLILSYSALPWYLVLLMILLASLAWIWFRLKQQNIAVLAQLESELWTVDHQQLHLIRLVDHGIYIVLFWQEEQPPCVIWCDQLSLQKWKQLKILAKLYRPQLTEMTK